MFNQMETVQTIFSRINRRKFMRMGLTAAIAPVVLSALKGCATGSTGSTGSTSQSRDIKFSHGFGLCNMPLFYSLEAGLFEKYNIKASAVMGTLGGDQATQLASGQVQMAVVPYTNAIAAYTQAPTFQVVAGSGNQGLIVVAKPEITSFEDLRGKKIATMQADTLEIVAYDYLKKAGISFSDVEMVYIADASESLNAFVAGQVDALSTIEPYATQALKLTDSVVLGDGIDLYGANYPDCVLAASANLIENDPDVVKDAIRVFFEAQYLIESDFQKAAETTVGKYYKTELDSLLVAAQAQPPSVDIREHQEFMYDRSQSMMELNYITAPPDEEFVNFTLLEEVIAENPELWERVKVKTV